MGTRRRARHIDRSFHIDEFDESNNVRSALVTNQPSTSSGDWDEDGDVDLDDFAEFPGCMSGPWGARIGLCRPPSVAACLTLMETRTWI